MPEQQSRVRPQRKIVAAQTSDSEPHSDSEDTSPSIIETGNSGQILDTSGDEDENEDGSNEGESDDGDNARDQLRNIPFSTLAKAQQSLPRKRKRDSDSTPAHEDKLAALRQRLKELRDKANANQDTNARTKATKKAPVSGHHDSDHDDDESSSSEKDDVKPRKHSRSSKHAPAAQPSNRQVSRKRVVIESSKPKGRDPRFNNPIGFYDPNKVEKTYAFLDEYRDSELADMKASLKKTKDADAKYELQQEIMALENRKRAKADKDRQRAVVREHRQNEKEAVAQGKQPFYLKDSQRKELAMVKKYEGMKGAERTKAIEKKQRKESQKEKRAMPAARRFA